MLQKPEMFAGLMGHLACMLDLELSLFRLVRRVRRERKPREKNDRVKSWGRDACFWSPGLRAAIFILAVFVRVTHDGLSETGTTRSLFVCGLNLTFP